MHPSWQPSTTSIHSLLRKGEVVEAAESCRAMNLALQSTHDPSNYILQIVTIPYLHKSYWLICCAPLCSRTERKLAAPVRNAILDIVAFFELFQNDSLLNGIKKNR